MVDALVSGASVERRASSILVVGTEQKRTPAEIAQLVEHNLAKVGVASSSLVFRSSFRHSFFHSIFCVSEVVRFLIHFLYIVFIYRTI